MLAVSERISSDVVCSTEPDILAGWQESTDELLIYRRPHYKAAAIEAYIDHMAHEKTAHMDQLHRLRLYFRPRDMGLVGVAPQDEETIWELNLNNDNLKFSDLFPTAHARPLLDDIEERLSKDAATAFPDAKYLFLLIKTQADRPNLGFHLDQSPILGYCHGKFPTEYVISNDDVSVPRPFPKAIDAKTVAAGRIQRLEVGDVSLMKYKPHRGMSSPTTQYKIWMGLSKPV